MGRDRLICCAFKPGDKTMGYPDTPPPPMPPPSGEPPYMTAEEAKTVTLGRKLRLRATWPTEGSQGCGPEVEVFAIANCPCEAAVRSQTNRIFYVRDKRDRCAKLDAAWFLPEPWMDPFFTP